MYRDWYGTMQGYGFGAFPWIHLVLGLAFFALVVVGLIFLIRLARRAGTGTGGTPTLESSSAFAILAERFARGEIDAETYRSMKTELEKS